MASFLGEDVFPFLVKGIFQGSVYGLMAVGLVLVYKGARVFNFAQGEFGTVAAYVVFAALSAGVPYLMAVVLGLIAALLVGLLMERIVVRPLLEQPRVTLLVASVGFALLVVAITVLVAKPEPRSLDPAIAGDPSMVFGVGVRPQEFLILMVLVGVAVGLAYFFNRTDRGLAVLATSQDSLATRVVGISIPGMSRFIWGFAAVLGGLAGILQAPIYGFYPGFMTRTSLVPGFTAAVLGGMTSLPGAFVGGIAVGVAETLGGHLLGPEVVGIPGSTHVVLFVMLLVVLMTRPQGLLGKEA